MSFSETIFLFVLALIIFGPKKLPEIARQIGKALNEFRRASNEFKAQIEQEISNLDVESRKQTILPPSPPLQGTASRTLNSSPEETSTRQATEPAPAEAGPAPATLAASAEEPAAGPAAGTNETQLATEAQPSSEGTGSDPRSSDLHDSEPVTSSTTQESHA